jgi:pyroglutamyl-peptidase
MSEPWILLTGFGPFPGVENNPTVAICEALNGRTTEGTPIRGAVLNVCFQSIEQQLAHAWGETPPERVVLLGVAANRHTIGVEKRAVNRFQSHRPDTTGFATVEDQVVSNAHPLDFELHCKMDTHILAQSLIRAGFPAESSSDAGRYLCNGVYFHALAQASQSSHSPECVFVHLPQVGNAKGADSEEVWVLSDLVEATRQILR